MKYYLNKIVQNGLWLTDLYVNPKISCEKWISTLIIGLSIASSSLNAKVKVKFKLMISGKEASKVGAVFGESEIATVV